MSQQSMRSLHLICRSRRSSAESESPIGAEDLFDMSSALSRLAALGMWPPERLAHG